MTTADTMPAAGWQSWGGSGPLLHFAHANGFPPGSYRQLLELLAKRFTVVSSEARPLWPGSDPGSVSSWQDLADDLAATLAARGLRGVIGVGHSLGAATTLLAAAADRELFRAVVAIDPLVLPRLPALIWRLTKAVGLGWRLPLARAARARQERWPSPEVAARAYRSKATFRRWQPGMLDDYLAAALAPDPHGGWRLRYPREWEARLFEVSPHDLAAAVGRVRVPVLVLRGAASDAFPARAVAAFTRAAPAARLVTVPDSGHLLPMERPQAVAAEVAAFAGDAAR